MIVTIDFETMSGSDLTDAGAWRYAECPTTFVVCLAYSVDGAPPRVWMWGDDVSPLVPLAVRPDALFVAHNKPFEQAHWRHHMVPLGLPDIPIERWRDTMAVCAYKAMPLGLDNALKALKLVGKDMEGSKLATALSAVDRKGWLHNYTPENVARVADYCKSDVEIENALHHRLGDLPPDELDVWLMSERMNERGLFLDREFITAGIDVVERTKVPLFRRFAELTGGLRPTQREKVLAWCADRGVKLPNYAQATIEMAVGVDEVEVDRHGEDDEQDQNIRVQKVKKELIPDVFEALTIRGITNSSSVKKLDRMLKCMCEDDRVRGHSQYHGAQPGRPTGRLFQPLNFPRGTIKHSDPEVMVSLIKTRDLEAIAKVGPPIEVVVSSLRHAVMAGPGNLFISGDFAGIQARVVLALAGEHAHCRTIAAGLDIYCELASRIFKRVITKADKEERQLGKMGVLGLGFGMGVIKFIATLLAEGLHVTDEMATEIVRVYRKEFAPGVPKLWYGLHGAATKAVNTKVAQEAYGIEYRMEDGWLSCRLPSGRKIWYWNPQPVLEAMPWDQDDIRPSWYYYAASSSGRMVPSKVFGGLQTENVVMGIERDIMSNAKRNLAKAGYDMALEVYDEALCEVPEDFIDVHEFRQCMLDVPQWCRDIQIPVDVPLEDIWVGKRYRK